MQILLVKKEEVYKSLKEEIFKPDCYENSGCHSGQFTVYEIRQIM